MVVMVVTEAMVMETSAVMMETASVEATSMKASSSNVSSAVWHGLNLSAIFTVYTQCAARF